VSYLGCTSTLDSFGRTSFHKLHTKYESWYELEVDTHNHQKYSRRLFTNSQEILHTIPLHPHADTDPTCRSQLCTFDLQEVKVKMVRNTSSRLGTANIATHRCIAYIAAGRHCKPHLRNIQPTQLPPTAENERNRTRSGVVTKTRAKKEKTMNNCLGAPTISSPRGNMWPHRL
jgi:hypothetical protein